MSDPSGSFPSWAADPDNTALDNHGTSSSNINNAHFSGNSTGVASTNRPSASGLSSKGGSGNDNTQGYNNYGPTIIASTSYHPVPSTPQPGARSLFTQQASQKDQNAFDTRPGTCYFSLVLVVLGMCFTCPYQIDTDVIISMVNRLLSYGEPCKIREFTPNDLVYFKSMYGVVSAETDAWIDHLRLMWSEQWRQLEWVLHGLSHGFRHGADPTSGLDLELYKETNVVQSRYLYLEGETLDLFSTDTPALRKILIDIIAESVQCDVVRPGETVTDTWSNQIRPPTPPRRRGPRQSKFEPANSLPNYPEIHGRPNRPFPYMRQRVAHHIASMNLQERLNVAHRLGLSLPQLPIQQTQYPVQQASSSRHQAPPGQHSLGTPIQFAAHPLHDSKPPGPKRQRTHTPADTHPLSATQHDRTPPAQQLHRFTDPFLTSNPGRASASPRTGTLHPRLQVRSRSSVVSMSPRAVPPGRGAPTATAGQNKRRRASTMPATAAPGNPSPGPAPVPAPRTGQYRLPSLSEALPDFVARQAPGAGTGTGTSLAAPAGLQSQAQALFLRSQRAGVDGFEHGVDPTSLDLAPMESRFGDLGGC